jgi:hypothetical protein
MSRNTRINIEASHVVFKLNFLNTFSPKRFFLGFVFEIASKFLWLYDVNSLHLEVHFFTHDSYALNLVKQNYIHGPVNATQLNSSINTVTMMLCNSFVVNYIVQKTDCNALEVPRPNFIVRELESSFKRVVHNTSAVYCLLWNFISTFNNLFHTSEDGGERNNVHDTHTHTHTVLHLEHLHCLGNFWIILLFSTNPHIA